MDLEQKFIEACRRAVLSDTPDGFSLFFQLIHNKPLLPHCRDWIDRVYEARYNGNRGAVIEAFRGSAKTTVTMTFVAYRIGLDPHKSNLVIQVGDDIATDNTANIAQIIDSNEAWKMLFPNVVPDRKNGWSANGYEVTNTSYTEGEWSRINSDRKDPTLVGLGRTSRQIVGKHPSGVCLIDDIDEELTTSSARERAKTRDLLTGTIFPTFLPGTWKIVVGTPWTPDDSIAYMKSTGEFDAMRTPVYQEDGTPTWPEVFDEKEIGKRRRISGQMEFARMYLLDLERAKGQVLKRDWLEPVYPAEKLDEMWPVYIGVDYASTSDRLLHKDADYFAAVWGRLTPDRILVIQDGVRDRISQGEAEQRLVALATAFPTLQQIGLEAIGTGKEFATLLRRAPVFLPLMPIPSHTGLGRKKGARFEKIVAPLFERNNIRISSEITPFIRAFIDEWVSWDGTSTMHDDTLDAVYMMIRAAEGEIAIPQLQPRRGMSPFWELQKPRINPFKELASGGKR